MENGMYGLMAEFTAEEGIKEGARRAYEDGYRLLDAYTPFPVDGLGEAIGSGRNRVPLIFLIGGVAGALGGFALQDYAMAFDYPLNVGMRPLHSWPIFIPVTFELMILISALSGVIGLFFLLRLPEPYHPVFNAPGFERATADRFFLCIEAKDPKFDREKTREFLDSLGPVSIVEVKE